MKIHFRKTLLAGTALVAVGAFAGGVQAAELTLTGNATWGTAGNGMVANPNAGDSVELDGNDLAVNEGDNTNIGAITDKGSTPDGNVTFDANAGDNAGLSISVGSAKLGSGDFVVQATEATTTSADAVAVTVTGGVSTTGNITVKAGSANAGDNATLKVAGDISANTITITDATTAAATLELNGSAAQTVAGAIAGNGDITVTNTSSSGVTFTGANTNTGTITVNNDGNDQAVTFTNNVSSAISLGDNSGTDTVTATFGGSSATTVSGTISGGGAADTVALVFTGGDTVTLSGAATSNIDTVQVTGNTTLDSNAAIEATTITVDSGSTLDQGAGNITAAVVNNGVIHQTGTGDITGNITGNGTLNIDESATYTGNVAASSADIATGKTLTFAGANTWSVTTTSLSGTGTLALGGANQTISGDITATADGDGKITISDGTSTTAFTGDIGTSDKKVASLDVAVAGGANNIVTTTGNLFVNAITLDDADSLRFIGNSAQTVSGTISGVGAGDGVIVVGDGSTTTDVTFEGVIGATNIGALTVNDGAKATFKANATFNGALSADKATIAVSAGSTLTAATQTDADVTTWNIGVDKVGGGSQTNGTVSFTGDAVNLGVDTVHFVVEAGSAPLTTGASVLDNVFTGTGAAATITNATVTDNSYIYGFELVADGNNVDVTITEENSINSFAATRGNQNSGNMLMSTLASSTNSEINQVQGNIAAASSANEVNEVLESTVSTVDAGAVIAAMGVTTQTTAITNTRLAALRSGDAVSTGMAAGDASTGLQVWGQAFGTVANQDDRDGIDGYDADTYGFAFGAETEAIADNAVFGIAFTYANTDVESENANRTETDVDSYQVTLYGDYDLDERTYVSGQLGLSFNDNDTTRYDVGAISGLTAKGNYDSTQVSVRLEGGRSYEVANNFVLTPSISANYMNYSADSYTETGAGGLNLTVDSDTLNVLEFGVAVEASWVNEGYDGSVFKPTVNLGVRHDVIGDAFEANNTFAGGGTAFKTEGFDPAQTTFNAGVGATYFSTSNWNLSASYDAEVKSDYVSHSGLVKAAYKF